MDLLANPVQLVELSAHITTAIDQKQFVSCIFLDLTKAFDMVDHTILKQKLKWLGVSEVNMQIFEEYLKNRPQVTCINGEYSSFATTSIGVPQGSNLGPIFFIIFINDFAHLKLNGSPQLFADDVVIKYKADSIAKLYLQMQADMYTIQDWLQNNKLLLNSNKSKYILFENHRFDLNAIDSTYKVPCGDTYLDRVTQYKYLGLWLNSKYKWDKHIEAVKKKILPYIFSIKKLRNIAPKESLKLIYNSYIHSQLLYLNPIWSASPKCNMDELFILQKRAIKYILNVNIRYPTTALFQKNFISFYQTIEEELLCLTFKIIHNLIKHNHEPSQRSEVSNYNTRQITHFNIDFFRTNMGSQNIMHKGLKAFNSLPINFKEETSFVKFKNQIRTYLSIKFNHNY